MAYGESEAGDPADGGGRRPPSPDDRVWRHPAEVALETRQALARRRARRLRTSTALCGGVAVAAGLLWLAQSGPASVTVPSDVAALPSLPDLAVDAAAAAPPAVAGISSTTIAQVFHRPEPTTTAPASAPTITSTPSPTPTTTTKIATTTSTPAPPPDAVTVRSDDDSRALGGAITVRDGYVVTSSQAVGAATEVMVAWGGRHGRGVVVGHDVVTDVAVIRVDLDGPSDDRPDSAGVAQGDQVTLTDPEWNTAVRTVVDEASTSARHDGEPVVGIVELDQILGTILPGTPAFDRAGAIVGMLTATADDAPAAIVPIDLVRAVAAEIIDLGWATHPWLGVKAVNPSDDDDTIGSLVTEVDAGGPAATGGVEAGDLIIEIDGMPIESMESMVATLRTYEPGDDVVVMVLRDDEPVWCAVALDSQRDDTA